MSGWPCWRNGSRWPSQNLLTQSCQWSGEQLDNVIDWGAPCTTLREPPAHEHAFQKEMCTSYLLPGPCPGHCPFLRAPKAKCPMPEKLCLNPNSSESSATRIDGAHWFRFITTLQILNVCPVGPQMKTAQSLCSFKWWPTKPNIRLPLLLLHELCHHIGAEECKLRIKSNTHGFQKRHAPD